MVQIHDAQSLDYICLSLASLQGFLIVNVMRDSWQCIPVWSERVGVQFHAWKCACARKCAIANFFDNGILSYTWV